MDCNTAVRQKRKAAGCNLGSEIASVSPEKVPSESVPCLSLTQLWAWAQGFHKAISEVRKKSHASIPMWPLPVLPRLRLNVMLCDALRGLLDSFLALASSSHLPSSFPSTSSKPGKAPELSASGKRMPKSCSGAGVTPPSKAWEISDSGAACAAAGSPRSSRSSFGGAIDEAGLSGEKGGVPEVPLVSMRSLVQVLVAAKSCWRFSASYTDFNGGRHPPVEPAVSSGILPRRIAPTHRGIGPDAWPYLKSYGRSSAPTPGRGDRCSSHPCLGRAPSDIVDP
eukprot:scaffold2331_cov252-Pinguiococcus_pyrenoidosus.AAC.7